MTAKKAKKVALARVEKVEQKREKFEEHKPIRIEPVAVAAEPSVQAIKEKQQPLFAELTETELPPLGLLDDAPAAIETVSADTLEYT